jgi:hypothetical protein
MTEKGRLYQLNGEPTRRMQICIYCGNNGRERCQAECQPEGKYRHLEPETLHEWESAELPPYRELVDWDAWAKFAILYLKAFYADLERQRNP